MSSDAPGIQLAGGSASVSASQTEVQPAVPASGTPRVRSPFLYQGLILLGALAVLAASALLSLGTHGDVSAGRAILPTLCVWRQVTGMDCPGCGLTRAFVALAHGRWLEAWKFNRAAPLIFALILYQVPFRAIQLVRLWQGRTVMKHSPFVVGLLSWTAVAALFAQWAWRMI